MKNRKDRHQKFFNDKFLINSEKIIHKNEMEIFSNILFEMKKSNKTTLTNDELKELLVKYNKYIGSFFVAPDLLEMKLFNLNLESVYLNLVKLDKQEHNDKYWAYKQNEFQKIFVLENDGKNALIALTYKDSFSPIIIDTIDTNYIYFEGNMGKELN